MLLKIYPNNPNPKEIEKVTEALQAGELIIYPTDTSYAIGCDALNVRAVECICKIKGINPQKANLSIICNGLSQASEYAKINNQAFQSMKRNLPGPFTFLLPTASSLPKMYKNRKIVGIRIPDHAIVHAIVQALGNPILTTTLPIAHETEYNCDPELIHEEWEKRVAIVIDDGIRELSLSTIVDCTQDTMQIIREGKGILQ